MYLFNGMEIDVLGETTIEAMTTGISAGGALGVIWGCVGLVRAARARRNGNGQFARPGESAICRQHGEALAAGKERFGNLQESVDRIDAKVDRLDAKVDRLLERKP